MIKSVIDTAVHVQCFQNPRDHGMHLEAHEQTSHTKAKTGQCVYGNVRMKLIV